jgi:hypothetical protein
MSISTQDPALTEEQPAVEAEATAPVPAAAAAGPEQPQYPIIRLTIVAASPTLAAAMMTGGLFVGAGGRIWGAIAGLLGVLLAVRTRQLRRPAFLYVSIIAGILVIGLIAVVPTGFSNIFNLATQMRTAVQQSNVLRPPVDFVPGWHAILGWIMAVVGFAAAWLAVELQRPAFAILVTLPVIGLGSISLPDDQKLATGLVALVLLVLSLGILSGAQGQDEEGRGVSLAFELRRAARALPLIALVTVALYFAAKSSLLFPKPIYNPAQEAKLPHSIPLSQVKDRILFTVDAKFNGPWKMGSLDVYDGKDWRLPPFAQSSLKEVPSSGIVNKQLAPAVRATFTIQGLTGAILPDLPNTVGLVAIGPTLAYDARNGNVRVTQGQIKPGFSYIVAGAATPTVNALRHADLSVPKRYRQFLKIPPPPPAVQTLLRQTSDKRGWDRVDFMRERLLHTVTAVGAGTPVSVTPAKVQDMLAGSKEGTPFQIVAGEAMLARWAGVPSRIGYGFDGGDPGPGGVLQVRPKHGALFLEVFFKDYGWLPVIGDPLQAKQNLSSQQQQYNPSVVISQNIGVSLFLPILTESKPTFFEQFRAFTVRTVPILLVLLLIYYLWPLPYKAFRRARRRTWAAEEGPGARVALAYAEWRDFATDFGYRHESDTPLMYLRHVVPDDEHSELAWLATRALWGDLRGKVTDRDALAAEEMSRSLRRRLSQAHPATMRVVAKLSRLSVRHPYAPALDRAAKAEGQREREEGYALT